LVDIADGDEEPPRALELVDELLGQRRRGSSDVDGIESSFGEIGGSGARSSIAGDDFDGGWRGGEGVGSEGGTVEGGERVGDESGNVVDAEDEASRADEVGED